MTTMVTRSGGRRRASFSAASPSAAGGDLAQPLAPPGGSGAAAGGRQAASEGDAGGSGRGGVSAAAVTPDSAVFSQSGSAATRLAALRAEVDNVPNLPADLLRALLTCARVHPPPAADAGAAEMRYSWLQAARRGARSTCMT